MYKIENSLDCSQGFDVQVYTDLIESRNLPSMPVIKDVTINGDFNRERTLPPLP